MAVWRDEPVGDRAVQEAQLLGGRPVFPCTSVRLTALVITAGWTSSPALPAHLPTAQRHPFPALQLRERKQCELLSCSEFDGFSSLPV